MNLQIATLAGALLLKWDVPAAGHYFLLSTTDYTDARVEASGHVWGKCHAARTIRGGEAARIYWVWFVADETKGKQ